MKNLRRVGVVIATILSILVLILSVGGIFGSWAINGAFTNGIGKVLGGVERALEATDNGLDRVDARLVRARENVNTIEEAVTQVGQDVSETNFALLLIEKTVGEELLPKIETARETVDTIRENVVAFNNTLEAVNELPFVSVPTLTDELQAASERVAQVAATVEEIGTSVQVAKEGAVEGAVSAITSRTSKIDSELAGVQTAVANFQARIDEADAKVASLKSKIAFWIDVVTILVTLLFLWVACSQVVVLGLCWSYFRTGELVLWRQRETVQSEVIEPGSEEELLPDESEKPEVSQGPEPPTTFEADQREGVETNEPESPAVDQKGVDEDATR